MNILFAISTTVASVAVLAFSSFDANLESTGSLAPPESREASALPAWEYEVPPPGRVTRTDQLVGAFMPPMEEGQTPQQIHEIVFGITGERNLGFAVLRTADRYGNGYSTDSIDQFEHLVFDTSEIQSVNIFANGQTLANLDALSLYIDREGFLRYAEMAGTKSNGQPLAGVWLADGDDPVDPEAQANCGPTVVPGCFSVGGCSSGCTPASCSCTSGGGGSCTSVVGAQCYGTLDCKGSKTCQSKRPGDPSECKCKNPL